MQEKKELQENSRPVHVNPYEKAVKEHVPAAGDTWIQKSPSFNGFDVLRLKEKTREGHWVAELVVTRPGDEGTERTVSEQSLRDYFRPLLADYDETLTLARMVVDGRADEVALHIFGVPEAAQDAGTEELMASASASQVLAVLDEAERQQNRLEEVKNLADILIEQKRYEMERKLDEANEFLSAIKKKVSNLVKIITVLNLYTGKTVDLEQLADGESAAPEETLHLRQRILYMDEELCAHLDYEADYSDIPLFKKWVCEKDNRDIIVPEQRCIVALKPKRHDASYCSGNAWYNAQRNAWNKHTYLLIRNGEKLFFTDSEDLELFDWAFPHSDFEEEFRKKMADPSIHFKDSLQKENEQVRYRTTKYMVYLQGIIDSKDEVLGPMDVHPNLMKTEGVVLVRDDENLVGTGRKPWKEFVEEKNRSIRVGTRVIFVPGGTFRDGPRSRKFRYDGEFVKWYEYESSEPETPCAGIYSIEPYYEITGYENHKPVRSDTPTLVFRYLPEGEVWYRNEYGYIDVHKRSRRVAWKPAMSHVINYDAITLGELRAYMQDRTLRNDFSGMMPLLKKALLQKEEENRDESAFKNLVESEYCRKHGREVPMKEIDEAVAWWKEKVIYTRPLRSDDAKAFRMIMKRLENTGKQQD